MKKAVFFDLDNTVYDVDSVANKMLSSLFGLIKASGDFKGNFENIKKQIMQKPIQIVAGQNDFSEALFNDCVEHLRDLEYGGEIYPFDDFMVTEKLPVEKFLVTSGFTKMQMSKVKGMKLENFFKEIHVVDFLRSNKTKRDVFEEIMKKYIYEPTDILVVGDDLYSEIQAAKDLNIDYVLIDKRGIYDDYEDKNKIDDYNELKRFV